MATLFTIDESIDAPDLLRRFVATPYETVWMVDSLVVTAQCNEEEILGAFPQVPPGAHGSGEQLQWRMRVVMDAQLNINAESPSVAWDDEEVLIGRTPQTFFAVDREIGEAYIFVREFEEADFRALVRGILPVEREQ